ncbi:MAG: DEAD/DEAH box helicase [Balneolaceae bacterium]
MSFSQLRIGSDLLQSYKKNHIGEPTLLQKRLIQAIREGGDVLVYDPSGTESEIGYLTSLLDFLAKQERKQGTRAVIISPDPTHLAHLNRWILMISEHLGVTTAVVDSDSDNKQIRNKIAAGPSIILATPTELAEWMEENRMILRDASWYILDQVSKVDDWQAVDVISQRIIGNQQRIAALATEEEDATEPLKKLLREPIVVHPPSSARQKENEEREAEPEAVPEPEHEEKLPDPEEITLTGQLTQYYIQTPPRKKISTLLARLEGDTRRSIIFTASQRTADRLYRILRKNNHRAVSLGPSLEEETRNERLNRFATGDVPFLIAGDTSAADCALGDIEQVINYDVPEEVSEYKLRAERLADESTGMVLSLVSKQDREDIREIIGQLGYAPEELPLPDKVVEESKQPAPPKKEGKGDRSRSSSSEPVDEPAQKKSGEPGRSSKNKRAKTRGKGRSSTSGSGSRSNGSPKSSSNDSRSRTGKKPRPQRGPKVDPDAPIRLPKPSFDKLSGGRSGKSGETKGGLVGWMKKLFS